MALWRPPPRKKNKKLKPFLSQYADIYPERLTTGYYGALTTKAIQRFQVKYNIVKEGTPATTGYGRVGPKTLKKMNELLGFTQSTPTALPTVPATSSPEEQQRRQLNQQIEEAERGLNQLLKILKGSPKK